MPIGMTLRAKWFSRFNAGIIERERGKAVEQNALRRRTEARRNAIGTVRC